MVHTHTITRCAPACLDHISIASECRELGAVDSDEQQGAKGSRDLEGSGVLSGMLARTQGYGPEQRRRGLNDALLFATARKYGCAVLSRNVRDFDLLQQLDPSGRVIFYKIGAQ